MHRDVLLLDACGQIRTGPVALATVASLKVGRVAIVRADPGGGASHGASRARAALVLETVESKAVEALRTKEVVTRMQPKLPVSYAREENTLNSECQVVWTARLVNFRT